MSNELGKILRKSVATGASTAMAMAALKSREKGTALSPINAVSHMVHGDEAKQQDELSWRYTGTALALHGASVLGWAVMHRVGMNLWERARPLSTQDEKRRRQRALLLGFLISTFAYIVDYKVAPKRFQPGFERYFTPPTMAAIYTILALALATAGEANQE